MAGGELAAIGDDIRVRLDAAHRAREAGLVACRRAIRACGMSIRAVHRGEDDGAVELAAVAAAALAAAQQALRPHPALAYSGPLHDAEKEYAEARLTAALVADAPLPGPDDLGVEVSAWLGGLCEAASELRRYVLDRLREGHNERAEHLLEAMDEVYGLLVTLDYPDALTGGLRRSTDSLRAVLERTRGDLTTTLLQARLRQALEERFPPAGA